MSQQSNNNESPQVETAQKPSLWIYAAIVSAILVAVIWLLLMPSAEPEQKTQIVQQPIVAPEVEEAPAPETFGEIEEPQVMEQMEPEVPVASQTIEETAEEQMPEPEPITEVEPEVVEPPKVEKNSAWLMTQFMEILPSDALVALLNKDELINNFVVFVDNASRGQLLTSFSPLKEPNKKFIAIEDEENQLRFTLDSSSYERYDLHAQIIASLPTEKSLEIYQELQEAIDKAHQQLGYETGSFDRKLIRVLDYLIETPLVTGDIELVAPSAMYQFAEPELENLMAIQKLLIRMGPNNQQQIQDKLKEFRSAVDQ
ncbi:MAG: DUF3014 domain-containing protein [Gammaproteobacteria bacterium]|nr:DUF3014 domain-containing protein [Gammaproteobacteria bacterium]